MSYQDSVENNPNFSVNMVVLLDGEYYAKFQPDSGLTIDSDKLIIDSININPTKINLRNSNTTINSSKIRFIDKNERFSSLIGSDEGALVQKQFTLFLGRIGESMDFTDYLKIHTYKIKSISKSASFYDLQGVSLVDDTQRPVFDAEGNLDTSISDTDTTIVAQTNIDVFPTSGYIKIDDEYILYSATVFDGGADTTTFTVTSRGVLNSTAVVHTDGAEIFEVYEFEENPVDIFLQLMISPGGGGPYDVLTSGIGIDASLIDVTAIEAIRDTKFSGDTFKQWISNPQNALKWLQKEILQPNNLRIIENAYDDKISLALLDESDFLAAVPILDETNTRPNPKWSINNNEIQNVLLVKYAWNEGLQRFTRSTLLGDNESMDKYGASKQVIMEIKGAQVALGGDGIATDRGNRFLARFATPRVKIKATCFASASLLNVGEKVRFISSELPQEGGALGMNSVVEILGRSYNHNTGDTNFELAFTTYSNLRIGLIAPSPLIASVIDQRTFTVADASCFKVGDFLKLTDDVTGEYVEALNDISSIAGNTITMRNDFSTTLTTSIRVEPANYNEASSYNKGQYAFVSPDSGFFDDGSKSYQIIT